MVDGKRTHPRRKHVKKRTGCKTCRRRRVKCDETKPACLRCINLGANCEGYQSDTQVGLVKPKLKPLIPKEAINSIKPPPSTALFTNQQDHFCFQHFCEKTAFRLTGCWDCGLWTRLVQEGCESDLAIRHAVVAIAALDFALEGATREPSSTISNFQAEKTSVQQEFAHQQYGTAIRLMRNSIAGKNIDIRCTLIGCIVIACYEALNGNNDMAAVHIRSGSALLENWDHKITQQKTDDCPALVVCRPTPVYDRMRQAFESLDIQMFSFVYIRTKEAHDRVRQYGTSTNWPMPAAFELPKQALAYHECIMRRILHFNTSISANADHAACAEMKSSTLRNASIRKREYQAELQSFYRAFEPLYQYGHTPAGAKKYHPLIAIKGLYLATCLIIDGIPIEPFDAADFEGTSLSILDEIASLSEILRRPDGRGTSRLLIVEPLYLVGMKCRHIATRRRALALFLSSKGNDTPWSGRLVRKALAWIADIEEVDAAGGGFLPPNTGVIDMKYYFDSNGRGIRIKCWLLKRDVQRPVERSITIQV